VSCFCLCIVIHLFPMQVKNHQLNGRCLSHNDCYTFGGAEGVSKLHAK
jgi:hypothetical protein